MRVEMRAFNNGLISGALSGQRMFVFQLIAVFLLPKAIGTDSIRLAMPAAEICVLVITLAMFRKQRGRYGY